MNIVKASKWVRRGGMLPSRVVIRHRKSDDSYITHVQCKNPDGETHYVWGHYDLTLAEAQKDFTRRVKSL